MCGTENTYVRYKVWPWHQVLDVLAVKAVFGCSGLGVRHVMDHSNSTKGDYLCWTEPLRNKKKEVFNISFSCWLSRYRRSLSLIRCLCCLTTLTHKPKGTSFTVTLQKQSQNKTEAVPWFSPWTPPGLLLCFSHISSWLLTRTGLICSN